VGSASHDREVYTAYHTPDAARARARAAGLEVVGGYGIFVVTPHPFTHRLPLAGAMLGAMERTLTQGPFARWAGFYIVACRKPGGRR